MATARDRKVWSQILELYHREYPYLWDKSHTMYSNQIMRKDAYQDLIQIYRDNFDKDATLKILKKKLANMRTTYYGELRKIKESVKSGSDQIYQPTLWYFNDLNFLANTSEDPLKTEELTFDSSNRSDNSENEASTSQETRTITKKPQLKKKHITVIKKQEVLSNNMPRVFTTITEDWEVFGRSIGLQLRDISQQQLTIASKLISDTIYYAKLNKLTENSRVEVGITSPQYEVIASKLDI